MGCYSYFRLSVALLLLNKFNSSKNPGYAGKLICASITKRVHDFKICSVQWNQKCCAVLEKKKKYNKNKSEFNYFFRIVNMVKKKDQFVLTTAKLSEILKIRAKMSSSIMLLLDLIGIPKDMKFYLHNNQFFDAYIRFILLNLFSYEKYNHNYIVIILILEHRC